MTYKAISIIINLLSTFSPQRQEVLLIAELNKCFRFDINILLVDSSLDISSFINTEKQLDYTPHSLHIFDSNNEDNITGLETFNIPKDAGNNIMWLIALKTSDFEGNLKFLRMIKKIQLRSIYVKIGIFLPCNASNDDLQKLFRWCWENRIVKVFAAFYSNCAGTQSINHEPTTLNTFNYNPFGTFDVVNVTGSKSIDKIFVDKIFNFQRHPFRLAILPFQLYKYSEDKIFDNQDGRFWTTVFHVLNATFSVYNSDRLLDKIDFIDNDSIDVSPYDSQIVRITQSSLYLMKTMAMVMVVPESMPYPEFAAYLKTMTEDSFFGYSLIIISVVILLLAGARYMKQKKILFFESIADVVNLIMNDNGAIKYPLLTRSEIFLIIPLTIVGLVFVNGILSLLQTYITKPIQLPQINTAEDLYKSPVNILFTSEYWANFTIDILNHSSNHDDWSNKAQVITPLQLRQSIKTYDRSISFEIWEPAAKVFIRNLKLCDMKVYRMSQIKFADLWTTYEVRRDFPFTERVNEVNHWIKSAGLYDKWWNDDNARMYFLTNRASYASYVKTQIPAESFPVPVFITYGWIASFIVLIIEILWKKFTVSSRLSSIASKVFNI